jgi:hypothetical protein
MHKLFQTNKVTTIDRALRKAYATKPIVPPTGIDKEETKKVGKEKLESDPEHVTTTSSTRTVLNELPSQRGGPDSKDAKDIKDHVASGVSSDLVSAPRCITLRQIYSLTFPKNAVKEALALDHVPREPYILGLAGTIPYFATSLSTLYFAWNLRNSYPTASAFWDTIMVSGQTAEQWLHQMEHIQLGYGAVIISFLGAVHWVSFCRQSK